ncbi:MAG: DUF1320 family protein [Planctomycetaceae bacterium]|nr:DUF1320 family protein [Planctomycetaceae bacterium]
MAYATLQDIFQRWGETNVREAANINADNPKSVAVTRRIKYFLEMQSHEIEARLRGCAYKVPFDPIPPMIVVLCAEMAYIAMFHSKRSLPDGSPDPFVHVIAKHNQIFADIHARRFRLGTEQHAIDIPMVVGAKRPKATFAQNTNTKIIQNVYR